MDFPEAPRVVFQRQSLEEVICQIRFAPILRIEETRPVAFQEQLRTRGLVAYTERQVSTVQFPALTPFALPAGTVPAQQRTEHVFATADGNTKVILARDFVAVDSIKYEGWHQFEELIRLAAQTAAAEYAPVTVTRVGLRYQNVIVPSQLDLAGVQWTELIRAEILGLAARGADVVGKSEAVDFQAGPNRAQIRHGLVEADGDQPTPGYLIDSDFYAIDVTSVDSALARLNDLHERAWRLFRWCITDRLYQAMRPQPIGG